MKITNFTGNSEVKKEIGKISKQSGFGNLFTATQNAFYGINHGGVGIPVPANSDHFGLTFFTRPRLNLSYHNVLGDRRLHPLLNEDPYSFSKAIRCYLDPESNRTKPFGVAEPQITSPLVDQDSAFIGILSNTLLSLSGWPDVVADTYTSNEGREREQFSFIDGPSRDYTVFSLTANFRNIAGDPITLLFQTWLVYATQVYAGILNPWPDSVLKNEIDYQTSIWRLVLDPSKKTVRKIGRTPVAFPISTPLGSAFNFNSERPVSEENEAISVQFQCAGAEYNDPILIYEFNSLVQMFNPLMNPSDPNDLNSPPVGVVQGKYAYIDTVSKTLIGNKGYPRINSKTMELEWYAPIEFWE